MTESVEIKRIRQILDYFEISISELGRRIGVNQSNLSQILKGNRPCGEAIINKIVVGMGINKEWLHGADVPMLDVSQSSSEVETRPDLPVGASAGFTEDLEQGITPAMCRKLPVVPFFPAYDLTMPVYGESMSPTFVNGETVALRRCYDIIEWGAAHVVDTYEGVYIKRIFDAGDSVLCVSDNPDYPEFTISKEQVRGIYRIVASMRIH